MEGGKRIMKFVFISLPMKDKTDKEIGHRLCSINGAVKAACVAKFGWKWDEIATIDNFWDHDKIEDNQNMPSSIEKSIHLLIVSIRFEVSFNNLSYPHRCQ